MYEALEQEIQGELVTVVAAANQVDFVELNKPRIE
jgi:hypothetical protein